MTKVDVSINITVHGRQESCELERAAQVRTLEEQLAGLKAQEEHARYQLKQALKEQKSAVEKQQSLGVEDASAGGTASSAVPPLFAGTCESQDFWLVWIVPSVDADWEVLASHLRPCYQAHARSFVWFGSCAVWMLTVETPL